MATGAELAKKIPWDVNDAYEGLPEDLKSRAQIEGDCIIWQGPPTKDGYGQLRRGKKVVYAHRAAVEGMMGEPIGRHRVIRICKRRLCINPHHYVTERGHKA